MMFALAGRLLGLYLKRFSLQSRLSRAGDGKFPLMFFVFSVPLLILTAAFVAVLFQSVAAEWGVIETYGSGVPKGSFATTLIGLGAMTALVGGEGEEVGSLADGRAAGQKRMSLSRAAVESQGSEQGIDADDVVTDPGQAAGRS